MKKTAVFLAWGAVLSSVAAPSLRAAGPFMDSVFTITASTTMGYRTAVALDNQNTIHAAFFDPTDQRVKYVRRTNGSAAWGVPVRVGDTLDLIHSSYTAMGLDAARVPHIIYYSRTSAKLRRTRLSGAVWITDDIDTFVSTFPYVSMAMTSTYDPRVLYNDEESTCTKMAVWSGAAWSTYTVTSGTMAAPGGIAVGADGRIQFAGNFDISGIVPTLPFHFLAYAAETSPGSLNFDWNSFILGSTGTVPGNVSLAVDSNNAVHIAAFDEINGDLWYLTGSTSTVVITTAATTGWVGRASSIAVDASRLPWIAALDDGVGVTLFHCPTAPCNDVSRWSSITAIDATATAGEGLDLKLNVYGSTFMTYYDGGVPELRFATTANRGMSLSGAVRDNTAAPITGVTVTLNGNVIPNSVATGAPGTFLFTDLLEGMYVLTPSMAGHGFEPASRGVGPLFASAAGLDFVGGPVGFSQVDNLIDPTKGEVVTLKYSVLSGGISIRVFDLNGRLVRTIVDQSVSIGTYTTTWDGRNSAGEIVASGIYLVRVLGQGVKTTQKIAVVK